MPNADDRRERSPYLTLFLLAGLFFASLWTGAIHFIFLNREETVSDARVLAESRTQVVEEQMRRTLRVVEALLASTRLWAEQHPQADLRSDAQFAAIVQEFGQITSSGLDIRLVARDGSLYDLRRGFETPKGRGDGQEILAAPRTGTGLQFGAAMQDPIDRQWKLPVSIALPDNQAGLSAAVAVVDLASVEGLFSQELRAGTGEIALVRRDGVMLAHVPGDRKLLGRSLAQDAVMRDHVPRRPRDIQIIRDPGNDGAARLVSYSLMPDYPLVLIVSTSVDELLSLWRRQTTSIVVGATAISLVALAVIAHLVRLLRALDSRRRELGRLASMDVMTGTLNHSTFIAALERDFARSRRYGQTLAVMVLDIDFFKQINDGYGHAVGDDALRAFAATLKQGLRNVDSVGRLGGEEFAILLPNTGAEAAARLAERLRGGVAEIVVRTRRGEEVRFTTSIGLAEMRPQDEAAELMLARADAALYAAKAKGRNRVEVGAEGADAG